MLLDDLLQRYREGLPAEMPWIIGASAFGFLASIRLLLRRPHHVSPALRWLLGGVVAAFAVIWAWELLWLADDAFFAFRYADNFARGHGIVFNPGERVEGYTDFLWVVLLAIAAKAGAEIMWASVVLSLAALVGVVLLTTRLANILAPPGGKVLVSFAALLVASNYIMANYGTSGLETMLGAFLVLLALDRALANQPFVAGLSAIAASMTHPDHIVFYGSLGLALLLGRERIRTCFWYALPFVIVFVPYYLWRWSYYGDFFPNTYYTKSADRTYFAQGYTYVVITAVSAGLFFVVPLALLGALRRRRNLIARYFLISTPLFTFYVAKIGGDFMLGRLFVPVLPVLFIMAECGARDVFVRLRGVARVLGFAGMAGLCLPALPVRVIKPLEKAWFVADERTFYPTTRRPLGPGEGYGDWARKLNDQIVSRKVAPKVAFSSAGIIAYLTRLPLIDNFGLTDRVIAHSPILLRGRPGHEKMASETYLISRKVDINEGPVYPEPYAGRTPIFIDGLTFYLANFRVPVLEPLKGNPKVAFQDIRDQIASYDPRDVIARGGMEPLECDLWFFEQYYFSNNEDAPRLEALRKKLADAVPAWRGLEPFVMASAPSGWQQVRAFHFDRSEHWFADGRAFERWPSLGAVPGQSMIIGNSGPLASSSLPDAVDDVTGRLTSEPFELKGDVITLFVGGGRLGATQRVSLLVDGERVLNATGCTSESMGRRLWNVSPWKGKTARIEIVDDAAGGWQHILVDEIVLWARTPGH